MKAVGCEGFADSNPWRMVLCAGERDDKMPTGEIKMVTLSPKSSLPSLSLFSAFYWYQNQN